MKQEETVLSSQIPCIKPGRSEWQRKAWFTGDLTTTRNMNKNNLVALAKRCLY